MDFLKSAVASAISKAPPFPYTFGDRVDVGDSIWTLFNGTKREDGSNCSIFSFEVAKNQSRLPLAKNALRKLRTLRHPGVVKVLDTVETDSYIYVATERVVPLGWHVKRKALTPETIKWGLHSVANTIKFINNEATSVHGNVRISSIYTTTSGEWKLSGFEVLSSLKDESPFICTYASLLPDANHYAAPEVGKSGWDTIRTLPEYSTDAWLFGCLMYEVFQGPFSSGDQLAQIKSIPSNMAASYKRLVHANPKMRQSVAHFLEQGLRSGGYFDIPLIRISEFVDNMGVKDEDERRIFLSELEEVRDKFPEEYLTQKILPELLKAIEFAGAGPEVFETALKIAQNLPAEDWQSTVLPTVVRMFAIPDRRVRLTLLNNLETMIDKIPDKTVNDKIFPDMMLGFSDAEPLLRETSLKSVLTIIPKLSDRNINGDLLKSLAKTQNDAQPGIRTNTTICLGKIAPYLGKHTRGKVLLAAFSRSLRDPFVHARIAALQAFAATAEFFAEEDCATKVLPVLTPCLIDKEKTVRVQSKKSIDLFLARVLKLTENYPETVLPPPTPSSSAATAGPGAPQTANEAAGAGWAGWAISSFAKSVGAVSGGMERQATPAASTPGSEARVELVPGTRPPANSSSGGETKKAPSSSSAGGGGGMKLAPSSPSPSSFLVDEADVDADAWASFTVEDEDAIFAAPAKKAGALPKGLAKKPAGGAGTGTGAAARKPVVRKPAKKVVEKKDWGLEGDEDGWGDGWDT